MMNIKHLLLSSRGRASRTGFVLGLIGFTIFVLLGNLGLRSLGNGMTYFYLAPVFWGLSIYMVYCIYGKRLHDIGRSVGPLMAMFAVLIMVMIIVMLKFGGAEYFAEFSKYERKAEIDPTIKAAIIKDFEDELNHASIVAGRIMWGVIAVFTTWLLLSKSQPEDNRYGPVPYNLLAQ